MTLGLLPDNESITKSEGVKFLGIKKSKLTREEEEIRQEANWEFMEEYN